MRKKYWTPQDNDNMIKFIEGGLKDQKLWLKLERSIDALINGLLQKYFVYNPSELDYILTDVKTDLYLKLHRYDISRGRPFNFITTVSLNLLRNRFKKEQAHSQRFVEEDVTDLFDDMY